MRTVTSFDGTSSRAIGSGTLIPEVVGSIILPSRPFVVVVCELAQESCGPAPTVGGTFGPCSELRGEVTLLDATDGREATRPCHGC